MSITVWQLPASPPSWAVRMMADILGIRVELKDVDFQNLEHKSPVFRKMNPMGTFPVMKDGDFTIAESHTIMKYLLAKYGKGEHKSLYPSDPFQQAQVDLLMYFDAGVAFIRVKNIALPAFFGGQTEISADTAKEVVDVYEIVEMYLEQSDYIASSEFTLADLSVGSTVTALNSLYTLDTKKYFRTAAWLHRLHQKTFFQNIALPGAESLSGVVKAMWQKNKANKQ